MAEHRPLEALKVSIPSDLHKAASLAGQLVLAIESLKTSHNYGCSCSKDTSDAAPDTRTSLSAKTNSVARFVRDSSTQHDDGQLSLVHYLERQLQTKDQEVCKANLQSQARDAEISLLKDQLREKSTAYDRLSGAHTMVLAKLANCERQLTRAASLLKGGTQVKQRESLDRLVDVDMHRLSERGDGEYTSRALSKPKERARRDGGNTVGKSPSPESSPDGVSFVFERPVQRIKRMVTKQNQDDLDETQRVIKQEPLPPPPELPPLNRLHTSLTQGLDLDGYRVIELIATPRKSRQPSAGPHHSSELRRPTSAPSQIRPSSPTNRAKFDEPRASVLEPSNKVGNRVLGVLGLFTTPSPTRDVPANGSERSSAKKTTMSNLAEKALANSFTTFRKSASGQGSGGISTPHSSSLDVERPTNAREILQEMDPNTTAPPARQASTAPKMLGKRKRDNHRASKIGELAEDGDGRRLDEKKNIRSGRLHDLLESGSPGVRPTPPRMPLDHSNKASKTAHSIQSALQRSNLGALGLADFRLNPARIEQPPVQVSIGNSSLARAQRTTSDGAGNGDNTRSDSLQRVNGRDSRRRGQIARPGASPEVGLDLVVTPALRADSPPGFWSADMDGTQELRAYKARGDATIREEVAKRHREAVSGDGVWVFRDE